MSAQSGIEDLVNYQYVSTGHLPPAQHVIRLVDEAYERCRSNKDGKNAQVYPALAEVPSDLFGICVVGTNGEIYAVGDADYEFSIMSVSKPFVFASVCQVVGAEEARRKLGANATGLPFNSLAAVERSGDGRTNPMVNAGAIATTSLVPGETADAKWDFIYAALSQFAGRPLSLNEEVYASATRTNFRNQGIARLLEELPLTGAYFSDRSQEIGLAEVLLPPTSELVGETLVEAEFRTRFGLTVIGLGRGGRALTGDLLKETLHTGDTLLLVGPWKEIERLRGDTTKMVIMNLPAEIDERLPAPGRALQALICLAIVIALMVSGIVPNVQAALIGCLLMGLFGCIDFASAYRSIDWKTIVLIVGMLPFSIALERTGGVDLAAEGLKELTAGAGVRFVLATLFVITAMLGMFISNTATAILMAPVALAVAFDLNVSPYPFAMIVALAASTAFMTPVSSPVNTLVVTPGRYTFGDFVRIGVPFSIVVMIVCVILVPWLLPP